MKWIGPGCLGIGGGERIYYGEAIPADVLTPDRVREFVDKGWVELEDDTKRITVPPKRKRKKNGQKQKKQ